MSPQLKSVSQMYLPKNRLNRNKIVPKPNIPFSLYFSPIYSSEPESRVSIFKSQFTINFFEISADFRMLRLEDSENYAIVSPCHNL